MQYSELSPGEHINEGAQLCFLVITLGHWGKGGTIGLAAADCKRNGAKSEELVLVRCYIGTARELDQITVNDYGEIIMPASVSPIHLVTPRCHRVKLSAIMDRGN